MSLNIKNERTHSLVRELAQATGVSQTRAVEDAVERRLAEVRRTGASGHHEPRDVAINRLLEVIWSNKTGSLRNAERELFDVDGLPR